MGQKAVLADTSSGAAAGTVPAAGSLVEDEFVDCEQPARSSKAMAAALAEHRFSKETIPILRIASRIKLVRLACG
jgi:hypothetical protein